MGTRSRAGRPWRRVAGTRRRLFEASRGSWVGTWEDIYFTLGLQPPPEKVVGVGLGGLTTF